MLTLVQIATNRCILNATRISDVGETPYHLLEPILGRLNAKQLAHLEESSPQLIPHSDKLWPKLIEKDFPDRPIYQGRKIVSKSQNDTMPNKTLYYRYQSEKELFRSDSAARLKAMTEKLKRQKLANAITTVPQLLRDPTVRRSTYTRPVYRNNILERARLDARSKSTLAFARSNRNLSNHGYNGHNYGYNNKYGSDTLIRRRPPTQFNTQLTQKMEKERISRYSVEKKNNPSEASRNLGQSSPKASKSSKNVLGVQKISPNTPKATSILSKPTPLIDTTVNPSIQGGGMQNIQKPHNETANSSSTNARPPKRAAPSTPSVFLSRKRPRPPLQTTSTIKSPQQKSPEPPSRLRAVKSSIFQN